MSDASRFTTALRRRIPLTPVPFWEIEFHLAGEWVGRPLVLGENFMKLDAAGQRKAISANAEIIAQAAVEIGFDAVTVPGGIWHSGPGQMAFYVLPPEARFEQVRALRRILPDRIELVGILGAVMSANYSEDFCVALMERPDEVEGRARKTLEDGLADGRRLLDCGCGAIVTASDIADNRGPFFNPEQMKRLILPFLKQFADQVHAWGCPAILHSDGNLNAVVNDLAETGVDGLQAVDPIAGMDLTALQMSLNGRMTLCGNIDCALLLRGTPAEVGEATSALVSAAGPRGGFILGTSNAVQVEVPVSTYRAMVQARLAS